MRHAMANRRRNNNNNRNAGGNRPQHNKSTVFDSNGPDVRIRGTAFQIVEKYMTLAKDAAAAGDRVLAENYLQHAEHYQRLIGSWADENPRTYTPAEGNNADLAAADTDAVVTPVGKSVDEDDLSLPASILGVGGAAAADEGVRAPARAVAAG